MTWWMWLLFWAVFWIAAIAYLAWRCWKVGPHVRDFTRVVTQAWEQLDEARELAERRADGRTGPRDDRADPSRVVPR